MIALLDKSKDSKAVMAEAANAWRTPIGAASPLWLMFAGAASAGVAFWWMSRWRLAPTNLEAALSGELPALEPVVEAEPLVEVVAEEAVAAIEEPVVETVEAVVEVVEAAPEPEPVVVTPPELAAAVEAEPVIEAIAESEPEPAPKPKVAPKPKAASKASDA